MKKGICFLALALFSLSVVVAGGSGDNNAVDQSGPVSFKVAHMSSETTPVAQGLARFHDLVAEKTNNRINIEVYNNGQLGSERDYVEACQLGTIDMAMVNQGPLTNFVSDLGAVDIPYLFSGYEHADKVFSGEVGEYYIKGIEKVGLKVIAIWEVGFRNLTNNKHPVNSVADVKGLRIRTMESRAHQTFWRSMGADPVPMSWGEAYTAMQQGAIDGQENPNSVILANNVAEVNKHMAVTEHVYSTIFFIVSPKAWNSLSSADQQIITQCAVDAGVYERQIQRQMEKDAIVELQKRGMAVTYPDKTEFIRASAAFRTDFGKPYAQILDKVDKLR